jgi:DNA-binding SARP family transcriptional activator/tetratricopeptide (TPR) repeat protein
MASGSKLIIGHRKGREVAGFAEFRLLGPLEVVVGGRLIEIGSARQRIVLAMLLLPANQVVPMARLIDAVWDDMPPTTAKSQVQTCISALRRHLAGAPADYMIVTRAVGYAMLVPDGALDVATFEQLAGRGRAAAADHRLPEAVADLRSALSMWRGPAADGVESKLVQAVAARLNENRVRVLEECIDLELALGRHHDLTGELSELVRQYPLRERLRAQHMLALYRSARQAEALESFREARQIFIDELGIEPGEELRAVERAILANDRKLQLDSQPGNGTDGARHGDPVIPRQLAAAISDFTGRQDVQKGLIARLAFGEPGRARYLPVVVCTGKGGVGKTALALQVAHAVRQDYPDGQLFAQLRDADGQPVSPLDVLAQFLRALSVATTAMASGLMERTAVYRSVLGDRRMLIVLDDADSVSQVTPLIPGSPNCAMIITSRHPLSSLHGAHHFEIDDLDEQMSIDLLAQVIGADRVRAESSAALALVRLCGCLPLALRIVAAKLATRAHWRIDKMVRRLTDEGSRLDELMLSGTGIRATLTLSYDSLSRDARRLFLRLGILGTVDFASWVSAPLLDMEMGPAEDVLDTLVEARLVEARVHEDGPPRFRLHDLVRIYALERMAAEVPDQERALALHRLLGCWLSLASEAHRRSYGGDFALLHSAATHWTLPRDIVDQLLDKPLAWFRAEHAGLVSAVAQAAAAGLDELCWDLAMTSVTLFESEYQVDDWRKTHEIALEATRRAGNVRGEAAILYSLGSLAVAERLGDAARYLDPALGIFEEIDDEHGRALTRASLAFVDRLGGRYEQALARFQQALTGFRAVGDRASEADALTNMAQIELDRERFDVVEALLDQALVICRSLRAPRIAAQTEHRLGQFFLRKGDLDRAERSFRYVLQLVREERDLVGEAYALQGLGTVHTRLERYALAEADLRAALSLSRRVGDNLVHGRVLLAYADFYLAAGKPTAAGSLIGEALVVFSEIGPAAVWLARFLELKARLDEQIGRTAAAAAARQVALELAGDSDPALSRVLTTRLRSARAPKGEAGATVSGPGTWQWVSGQCLCRAPGCRLASSPPRRASVAHLRSGARSHDGGCRSGGRARRRPARLLAEQGLRSSRDGSHRRHAGSPGDAFHIRPPDVTRTGGELYPGRRTTTLTPMLLSVIASSLPYRHHRAIE